MCAAEIVTCDLHKSGRILCPHLRLFRLLLPSLLATKLSPEVECFCLHQQCSAWRYSVVASCSGSWHFVSVWERGKRQGENYLVRLTYTVFTVPEGQQSVCVNAARCLCFLILNSNEFSPVFSFSLCKIPVFIGISQFWKRCCISRLLHKNCIGLTIRVQSCSWTFVSLALQPSVGTCHSRAFPCFHRLGFD